MIPETSETLKSYYRRFFGPVRQKIFDEKRDTLFSSINHFETKNFLKNSGIPLRIFRHCETWKIRRKIVIPLPLLIHKRFCPTRTFLKHRVVPWWSFFGLVRWKKFRQNREASPSFDWNFSMPEFLRNTEGFSYEFYRHCETKLFQRSLVISPCYA